MPIIQLHLVVRGAGEHQADWLQVPMVCPRYTCRWDTYRLMQVCRTVSRTVNL